MPLLTPITPTLTTSHIAIIVNEDDETAVDYSGGPDGGGTYEVDGSDKTNNEESDSDAPNDPDADVQSVNATEFPMVHATKPVRDACDVGVGEVLVAHRSCVGLVPYVGLLLMPTVI
jgi:hypothetical protein